MRTRTFLGLILLVAALLVSATPALLTPASRGVEQLAARAGVPGVQVPERATQRADGAAATPVESSLELKGYVAEGTDLRDQFRVGERSANHSRRLLDGRGRTLLPGERRGSEVDAPPYSSDEGILLDAEGCPVFRPETDVAKLWKNPDSRQLYVDRAASADDPAACRTMLDERRGIAVGSTDGAAATLARRELAGIERGDLTSMLISLEGLSILGSMFDVAELTSPGTATDSSSSSTATADTGKQDATG